VVLFARGISDFRVFIGRFALVYAKLGLDDSLCKTSEPAMSQMKKPPKRATLDYANALFQQQPATEDGRPYSNFNASGSVEEPSISADKVLNLRQAAAVLHCHPKTLRLMAKA
jgi:hypothetical protein